MKGTMVIIGQERCSSNLPVRLSPWQKGVSGTCKRLWICEPTENLELIVTQQYTKRAEKRENVTSQQRSQAAVPDAVAREQSGTPA